MKPKLSLIHENKLYFSPKMSI